MRRAALAALAIAWSGGFGVQVVPGVAWGFGTGLERDVGGLPGYLSVKHRFR
jgi:hypothetical protein